MWGKPWFPPQLTTPGLVFGNLFLKGYPDERSNKKVVNNKIGGEEAEGLRGALGAPSVWD